MLDQVRSVPPIIVSAVVALFVAASGGHCRAALASGESHCQMAAAGAARKFLKNVTAAIASCRERESRGGLPAGTDCRVALGTEARIADAAAKLEKRIARACTDSAVASLAFGGECSGATTTADLTACIRSSHDALADELLGVLYATSGALAKAGRRCQSRAARRARRFALERLRVLQRCKNQAGRGRLRPGVRCEDESRTAARIERRRAKAAGKIEAACASALSAIHFGDPCGEASDPAYLPACLLSAAGAIGDSAALAEYGDGGFCGDAYQAVEARIDALLPLMTLEEKVEQMHGEGLPSPGELWATSDNDRLGIPGFRMVDGPRGVSLIAGNSTAFPVAMARGATWDPGLEERVGEAIGVEARAKGGSVLLAPVTAVVRHPRWGRAQEAYGEDPLHVGRMGAAFVRGAQRHVIASAKHYALNTIEDTRFTVSVAVAERTLREIYLSQFKRVVGEAHVGSVMSAYNRVNGQYCAENSHLLRDVLKGEWGFRGFVESDWILGTRSTVPSALAGLDIEMPLAHFYGSPLVAAVEAGDVPEATIDEAVRRILRVKFCFRLDEEPPEAAPDLVESREHLDLALEVARKAIVLLKNEGGTLPLDRGTLDSLVVVGPLADIENLGDSGSSDVEPSYAVTALEGVRDRAGSVPVSYVPGQPLSPEDRTAIAAASVAVVVAGLTEDDEGESLVGAGDREAYDLDAGQVQLITEVAALSQRTVVVLEGGSAIGVEGWIDDVDALLMAWYPGQEGGNAIADVLFGDVNPSGKLPLTVARSEDDLPPFINDQDEVAYEYYHGYRLLDRDGVTPRFPFGFGLSYTTYAYANLRLSHSTLGPDQVLRASFEVTNTGAVAGDEIAQLYVGYNGSRVDRPVLDLKGFARVHLQAGETKTVSVDVAAEDLAFYDVAAGDWEVEEISYDVRVGPSSRDLPLQASFEVRAGR